MNKNLRECVDEQDIGKNVRKNEQKHGQEDRQADVSNCVTVCEWE